MHKRIPSTKPFNIDFTIHIRVSFIERLIDLIRLFFGKVEKETEIGNRNWNCTENVGSPFCFSVRIHDWLLLFFFLCWFMISPTNHLPWFVCKVDPCTCEHRNRKHFWFFGISKEKWNELIVFTFTLLDGWCF